MKTSERIGENKYMRRKILLVIDMQEDFLTGALANRAAQRIVDSVKAKVLEYLEKGYPVFFTRDTHDKNYLKTQEGKMLAVEHCLRGSEGWQITAALRQYAREDSVFDKPSFGSLDLPGWLEKKLGGLPEEIELCGVCTDICVISNAIILKAAYPEVPIVVDADCCAGVTSESHRNALSAMEACQILVKRKEKE